MSLGRRQSEQDRRLRGGLQTGHPSTHTELGEKKQYAVRIRWFWRWLSLFWEQTGERRLNGEDGNMLDLWTDSALYKIIRLDAYYGCFAFWHWLYFIALYTELKATASQTVATRRSPARQRTTQRRSQCVRRGWLFVLQEKRRHNQLPYISQLQAPKCSEDINL